MNQNHSSKFFLAFLMVILTLTACQPAALQTETQSGPATTNTTFATPTETAPPATLTPSETATHAPGATPTPEPTPTPATLIGAGDVAVCGEDVDEKTAAVLGQYPDAAIFIAGDVAYEDGKMIEYQNCYGPSWGQYQDRTHPSPGNHDYRTSKAAPYFTFFGPAAGEIGEGYYSYDLGDWHIVALNSNCNKVACGIGSMQEQWLRADLAAHASQQCTLAYWHHPRWSSGPAGNTGAVSPFWRALQEYGADVVVNGHDHSYERFAPQDADGNATAEGIREFVVGTGGAYLRDYNKPPLPNSEVRNDDTHGVIKFTLYPDHYTWEFLSVEGSGFTDAGSGTCH